MTMFVHKKLQCIVTELNYEKYNISSLDDPDMYRVTDIDDQVDFLENNVTFGDPVWNEEDKTVTLSPSIKPVDEEYKRFLLENYRNTCYQDMVTQCFTNAWKSFKFAIEEHEHMYSFVCDPTALFTTASGICAFPVEVCDSEAMESTVDIHRIISVCGAQLSRLRHDFHHHLVRQSQLCKELYEKVCAMSYAEVVQAIKQQNTENGIVPQNKDETITFSRDKDTLKRTVSPTGI